MLILIAGMTGNIGKHAAAHAIATGHTVRGLGRSPEKLPTDIRSCLESFVTSSSYYDIAALDHACAGADAVICAYSGLPELHLDGQLLLLRSAERAGIKRFLAASWNYDWRKIRFGVDEPVYDAAIAFKRQAEISSSIKPCWILSGMLAEVFFGIEGQRGFTPRDGGVWDAWADKGKKSMDIWGTGEEEWVFTTEEDAGRVGVEVVAAEGAEKGGFTSVASWRCSLNEVRRVYEQVRQEQVDVNWKGSVEELTTLAVRMKSELGPDRFWEWHRSWFMLFCVKGTWNLDTLENKRFEQIAFTGLEKFLKEHAQV